MTDKGDDGGDDVFMLMSMSMMMMMMLLGLVYIEGG